MDSMIALGPIKEGSLGKIHFRSSLYKNSLAILEVQAVERYMLIIQNLVGIYFFDLA